LKLDLSFLDEGSHSIFWEYLSEESRKMGLQSLMSDFQEFYSYLRNGIPFDSSFRLYELLSKFSSKFHTDLSFETGENLDFFFRKSGKVKNLTNSLRNSQYHNEDKTYTIVWNESLYSSYKLVLNFVEEFYQHTRARGYVKNFFPQERASTNQIEKIGG
jgi:hypothetical protein